MFRVASIFVTAAVIGGLGSACSQPAEDRTTNTRSTAFSDRAEKLTFLLKYVKCPTRVLDTEFSIVFNDNSHGLVPGPSDWVIRYAVRVDRAKTDAWHEGGRRVDRDAEMEQRFEALFEQRPPWTRTSSPAFYQLGYGSRALVYSNDGIVYKESTTR